jgi:hypothetical protein
MQDRRAILAGGVAFGALALAGCEKASQTAEAMGALFGGGGKRFPTYRYRLVVEVDTPEGVKRGSSVIAVRSMLTGKNRIPDGGKFITEAMGEAVTIDLGERGLLFALLRSDVDIEWAAGALLNALPELSVEEMRAQGGDQDEITPQMNQIDALPMEQAWPVPRYVKYGVDDAPTSGPPNGYPMLVRFTDIADPKSVERVDPDDLAKSFGKGVALKSITVARTEAKVTQQVEKVLPWLEPVGRQRATFIPNPPRFAKDMQDIPIQTLGSNEFSTELYK